MSRKVGHIVGDTSYIDSILVCRYVSFRIYAASSEEVAKNVLAKTFNLVWVQRFWDKFSQNVYVDSEPLKPLTRGKMRLAWV